MPNLPVPIDPGAVYLPVDPPRGHDAAARLGAWRHQLGESIEQALAAGHDVALECEPAGYLDTVTLGMLLRVSRHAQGLHRRVTLLGCTADQLEYFTTARLLNRLECQGTSDQARKRA